MGQCLVIIISLAVSAILLFAFWLFPIRDVDLRTLLFGILRVPLIALGNIRGCSIKRTRARHSGTNSGNIDTARIDINWSNHVCDSHWTLGANCSGGRVR